MKVLYFHQHFSTPHGTTGIRSYQMARHLVQAGHEVTMVCGSYLGGDTGLTNVFVAGRREGNVDGINIIELDLAYANKDGFVKRSLIFAKFALASIKIALTENYDIVFATTTPLTTGIPGILAKWIRRKPFVFEVRDLWPELPKAMKVITNPIILWAMSCLEWMSYHAADRCIGLSPGIVQGIEKRGIDKSKIMAIPNGCDLAIFEDSQNSWRPDGVDDNDLMAVFTGTHGMANGLSAVIEAAYELKKRNRNDIKIVLVGQGKEKAEIVNQSKRLSLDNVIFLEPVDKYRLSELMMAADLGLQLLANVPAFYYGTSPNKFFDYIAAGLPVLNNYPGWLAEFIERESCGFVVQPDNPELFADAFEKAADNRGELIKMGARASNLAKREFDRQKLADKWVDWVVGVIQ